LANPAYWAPGGLVCLECVWSSNAAVPFDYSWRRPYTAGSLAGLYWWSGYAVTDNDETAEGLLARAVERRAQALSEHDSKRVLAAYGVPVTREELVPDVAAAVAAAERIGYPVVVKACSPDLMHKSDQGLVVLNVADTAAVERAVEAVEQAADGAALDGYLVQQMVRGRREVIVGGLRDKRFGPCVMLGLGGVLVEAVADVAFRLAPLDERDALEMIGEIKAQRLFEAVRGEPAVDRPALSQLLMAVGRALMDNAGISQVDVNPVIFDGAAPVAVDALVTLTPAEAAEDSQAP